MTKPGPSVTSGADTQPGSDSLFPSGFGGGAAIRAGGVGTGEIADGSVAAADLNLPSVAAAIAARSELTGAYAGLVQSGGPLSAGLGNPVQAVTTAYGPTARILSRMAPSNVITTFQSGHGFTSGTTDASSNLNDTTNPILGSQCATIVTNGAGGIATLGKVGMTAVDFTGKNIRLVFRASGLANCARIEFYAGSGGSLANIYKPTNFIFKAESSAGVNYGKDNDWVYIDINWQDLSTAAGTPNRAAIDSWQMRVADDNTGNKVTVNFQGIFAAPASATYPTGVVSFTWDDTQASAYTLGKPVLDKYGYTGTWYTICDQVGNTGGGYMTLANLLDLYRQGHDIAPHAYTLTNHSLTNGFIDLSTSALEAEIRNMKEWLQQNGFTRGLDHFATPQGKFTPANLVTYAKYFASHRLNNAKTTIETLRPSDRLRLRSAGLPAPTGAYTTAAQITALIDNAYAQGGWLIIVGHKIVASGATGSLECLTADLTTIVDYCATKGIPVRTVHEVLSTVA